MRYRVDTETNKARMKATRWSLRKLGLVVGVSEATLRQWFRGTKPNAPSLKAVCDILGRSMDAVFIQAEPEEVPSE